MDAWKVKEKAKGRFSEWSRYTTAVTTLLRIYP
jgi:hypothetical protein